ncbi:MAG: hypothetical protein SH850_08030 [Planctomycetaceae bacterium]|nr:hypothetical protein [Planctomycetaceae bacterium]
MSRADVSAGKAFVSLSMKDGMTKPLQDAKRELSEFGSGLLSIGSKVAGVGAAITGGLAAAVAHFANVGSDLNDMSVRTGISTTALVEFGYAAEMTGTDMETLEGGIKKMQKNLGGIGPEGKKATAALAAMGIVSDDISGLAPEDQFQAIAESIGAIEDPSQRAAAAMAIFGGSGTDLLPMMQDIRALREEAQELGIAPSPESIAAADMLGDTIDKVRKVVSSAFFEIGAAVAPMAQDILDGFLVGAKAVKKFVVENKSLVITIAKVGIGLLAAGYVVAVIGSAFIGAGMAISGVLAVFSAFSAVVGVVTAVFGLILSPVGLLVAVLAAGVYAWTRFTESGRSAVSGLSGFVTSTFGAIFTTVNDTFGGIVDAIKAGDLELAGQIALTGLRLVFAQGLEAIHALLGETLGTMAGQLMSGDFSGAFATLGSTLLDSWAQITSGLVSLFSDAANAVMDKWQKTVNSISDYILESASQGGVMGWALEQVSGVNMQEEAARGKRIEAERRAKGMTPDNGSGLTKSDEFQHAGLAALKESVRTAGQAANGAMSTITDATGDALKEKTAGSGAQASAEVVKLRGELDALRAKSAEKVEALKAGSQSPGDAAGGRFGEGSMGKASAATFNLASLSTTAASGQLQAVNKTTTAIKDLARQLKEQNAEQLRATRNNGLYHK